LQQASSSPSTPASTGVTPIPTSAAAITTINAFFMEMPLPAVKRL
jgi:hypothetical protein